MSKLTPYDDNTFYGETLNGKDILGLTAEIRHGRKLGQKVSYIVYLNDRGLVKWKIVVVRFSKDGRPGGFKLYHRNQWGPHNRLHSQGRGAWGTPSGLIELVNYIRDHEQYEERACVEVYAYLHRGHDEWHCDVLDYRIAPNWKHGYSTIRLTDPDLMIHCFWSGGLPDEDTRVSCRDMIIAQTLREPD